MDLLLSFDRAFLKVLCMGLSGACVIALVLLVRLVLRRAPKRYTLILWAVALARLLIPFALESRFTLLPVFAEPVSTELYSQLQPAVHTGLGSLNAAINSALPAATPDASMNPIQGDVLLWMLVWLLGVIICLSYLLGSAWRLRGKLRGARHLKENIYLVAGLATPFVAGVFRPRIYLPEGLSDEETACIVAHEQIHIRRQDPLWKLLGFVAACIHWFNPFVWIAFFVSARDLEMACDEKAAAQGERGTYCTCLLRLATGKASTGLSPTAFSEGNVTPRIKRVLAYKKPPHWVQAALLLVVAVCGAALVTNPVSATQTRGEITRLVYGQETASVRADELADAAIMNVMVKSAAFQSRTDIETLPVCYRIRQTTRAGWQAKTGEYFAYIQDERSVMQYGADGWYSMLEPTLFTALEALFAT